MALITKVQGRLRSDDPTIAMEEHDRIVDKLTPGTRANGGVGHMVFANAADPREFLAIDRWESIEGLQKFMGDPSVQAEIGGMFDGQPDVTVWIPREGWRSF